MISMWRLAGRIAWRCVWLLLVVVVVVVVVVAAVEIVELVVIDFNMLGLLQLFGDARRGSRGV